MQVPTARNALLLKPLAAEGLTITEGRQRAVDFSAPAMHDVNERFKAQGLAAVRIRLANEYLEIEDLLSRAGAGLFGVTVADQHIAEQWQPLYSDMQIPAGVYAAGRLSR